MSKKQLILVVVVVVAIAVVAFFAASGDLFKGTFSTIPKQTGPGVDVQPVQQQEPVHSDVYSSEPFPYTWEPGLFSGEAE